MSTRRYNVLMTNFGRLIVGIIVIIVLGVIGVWYFSSSSGTGGTVVGGDKDAHGCIGSAGYTWCAEKNTCIRSWETYCTSATPKIATFTCAGSSTIKATFYPTDDKFVDLQLSDSRNFSVPHATSGSGARYAKADESFVFWNKGDTAFITEGAGTTSTTTFADCIVQ